MLLILNICCDQCIIIMSDISDSSVAGDEPPILVEDDCVNESEHENQIIVHIRTRLVTGQHAPGLSRNQRSNVNKQLALYYMCCILRCVYVYICTYFVHQRINS